MTIKLDVQKEFEEAYLSICTEQGKIPDFNSIQDTYTNWTTYDAYVLFLAGYRCGFFYKNNP